MAITRRPLRGNVGAFIITYTLSRVPLLYVYHNGPQNPILVFFKAIFLKAKFASRPGEGFAVLGVVQV